MRAARLLAGLGVALAGAQACQVLSGASQDQFGAGGSGVATGASAAGGNGGASECVKPGDCPANANPCIAATCQSGHCGTTNAAANAPCAVDAGKVCDGAGKCVVCNNDTQCPPTDYCSSATHNCRSKICIDGKLDGSETDVDCGGKECDPCANGKSCNGASDCASGFCQAGAGGGAPMGTCAPCFGDGDCAGKPNSYCSQGVCQPKKKPGEECAGAAQCLSGFCGGKMCCDKSCPSPCLSCAAKDTGGVDGTCAPAGKGSLCQAAGCKDADNAVAAGVCDDKGGCAAGATTNCAPYRCAAGACLASCGGDGDCASTHYCNNKACIAKKKAGETCGGAGQCASGFCVDGMCCDKKCDGACEACSKAAGAATDGTCATAAVKSGPDAGSCDAAGGCATKPCACDAAGACKSANGATCATGATCVSGNCADAFCCDTPCSGACATCAKAKGGAVDGTCAAVAVKNASDPGACDAANGACLKKPCSCDAAGACKNAIGSACGGAADCASGFCPNQDKVCCDKACAGKCEACAMAAFTGQPDGTCAFVMMGQDPHNDCPGAKVCQGDGTCN